MDYVTIEPGRLKGTVKVPPSKSEAHRAIIAAALSGGECRVDNIAMSADITATLDGMRALGCKYTVSKGGGYVKLAPKSRKFSGKEIEIDCAESGSTLRFLIPIALLSGKDIKFTGRGRLMQRPMKPYFDMFDKKGIVYEKGQDYLKLSGKLESGLYKLPGDISSQFITGLLFALPQLDGDSKIEVTTPMESKGYIDMTLNVLKQFGIEIQNKNYRRFIIQGGQSYTPRDFTVEGDYSQAAFFLVAGAIGCDVTCTGLKSDSLQGDKAIIDIIKQTGAQIEETKEGIRAVHTANMHGITVDVRDIPDLVPILAVLLSFCRGESRIINAGRLRMKESDRLAAITSELKQLGGNIAEGGDSLTINGVQALCCNTVSSWNDHRIAMATAIAACRCEGDGVNIMGGKEAVKKSYPDFFEVYERLAQGE